MSRGQPDFGALAPTVKSSGMADMAELAVRLGSIISFDRRGKVVLLDDFESPVLRGLASTTNGAVVLNSTYPKSGGQCAKLSVQNAASAQASIYKRSVYTSSPRLGVELSFVAPPSGSYLTLGLNRNSGTKGYIGRVRLDFATGDAAYNDSSGSYQNFITGLDQSLLAWAYHTIKMVVDFSTNMYVRFMYAGQEYDLSSYALEEGIAVSPRLITFYVIFTQKTQAAYTIYIDDFILTEEEP